MGCNAWNHAADCDCGWGGDTGGGGRFGAFPVTSYRKTADGLDWSFSRSPTYETYTTPNARCPICGEEVFFCRSPTGGSVFFDELGPPWSKHPCTDTYIARGDCALVLSNDTPRAQTARQPLDPTSWSPFIPKEIITKSGIDYYYINDNILKITGNVIAVADSSFRYAPIYWRRDPHDPAFVEISSISIDRGTSFVERRQKCASWASTAIEAEEILGGMRPGAVVLNALGWSMSFAWMDKNDPEWHKKPFIDWKKSIKYFEESAKLGNDMALNNLGVIFRDGLGVLKNPEASFNFFKMAADQMDPHIIRNLAHCYLVGWGTEMNVEQAEHLYSLADVKEKEQEAMVAKI